MMRMISGIGIPRSQSRIGMMSLLSFRGLAIDRGGSVSLFAPSAVAKTATFGRRERRGERSDEQRQRQPDRGLHRRLAGLIQVLLDLGDHVIDAFLSIGLA